MCTEFGEDYLIPFKSYSNYHLAKVNIDAFWRTVSHKNQNFNNY